jgi:hypothetical protein
MPVTLESGVLVIASPWTPGWEILKPSMSPPVVIDHDQCSRWTRMSHRRSPSGQCSLVFFRTIRSSNLVITNGQADKHGIQRLAHEQHRARCMACGSRSWDGCQAAARGRMTPRGSCSTSCPLAAGVQMSCLCAPPWAPGRYAPRTTASSSRRWGIPWIRRPPCRCRPRHGGTRGRAATAASFTPHSRRRRLRHPSQAAAQPPRPRRRTAV